jgi:hypothetical protein
VLCVAVIIGKGGANIKEIRRRHQVQVNIDRHAARDGSKGCVLLGSVDEDLQAAAQLVAHLGAGLGMPPADGGD